MNGLKPGISRLWVQAIATLLTNGYLKGFFTGSIFVGASKHMCVPTLNCYSCPGALFSCPIGAMQVVFASGGGMDLSLYSALWARLLTIISGFPFFVVGLLTIIGSLVGRATCGWLCPFGWLQDLMHRIPSVKWRGPGWLSYGKYVVLVVFVFLLPFFWVDASKYGEPTFCEYICPAGTLEGGILLPLLQPDLRKMLGKLFLWKFSLLIGFLVLMVFVTRPFCRWVCPLGAFFAPFNRVSRWKIRVEEDSCIQCGACARVCPTALNMPRAVDDGDCLRCLECVNHCPKQIIHFQQGDSAALSAPETSDKSA